MRILTLLQAIIVCTAIILLAACSGGSAVAPKLPSPQRVAYSDTGRALGQTELLDINPQSAHRFKSFDSCPVTGPIKYVSDYRLNVINVYTGKFAGQAPCGQISSSLLSDPIGLFVDTRTHDLYVANDHVTYVLVFHRGQTNPYNTYTDPTGQVPLDVVVAHDGTVIASNLYEHHGNPPYGSLSTWIGGPNGGTFVGNFLIPNAYYGGYVTVKEDDTIYFSDTDATSGLGLLWSVSCPAGKCGRQTQIAGVSFQKDPVEMAVDSTGDLLTNDIYRDTADTFELPNPSPSTFPLVGLPSGMAINKLDHHWFVSDPAANNASEYLYPSGKLIGTVLGNAGGNFSGIAVDP